ncbi:sensor histidine kinase [Mariniflexile sp. AS56]|uniref:sensor histidine kinase n=1 Tax=Mariniflexile sp. AS56 TaxID=3063957 RepID=UPI0026EE6A40|nr:histidine kinase [Mariniflexile sp. AS56]MDO7172869.1 histidine kinase [Mariniflexile sp. AS56]
MEQTNFTDRIKRNQIVLHVSILAVFICFSLMQPRVGNAVLTKRIIFTLISHLLLFYINYAFLVTQFLLKKKTLIYVVSVLSLIILSAVLVNELAPELRPNPNLDFNPSFGRNRPDSFFRMKLIGPFVFNTLLIVTGAALRIYSEWNTNERKKKEIEVQRSSTELHFLKHQLSPHFLFNSLNSIYSLTTQKSNDAPEAIITLSELMRYMLYETNSEFVPLSKELDYIQNYLKLQRLRIANNKDVTVNIRGGVANQKIRPLLFISFIENAFKYGTDFKGHTEVKIEINVNDQDLHFKCINVIGNRKTDKDSSGIGLQNTKERLELLYPNKHVLVVEEKDSRFIVNLELKLS